MNRLVSPASGRELAPEGPFVLTDGEERWPVLDGIPYLRIGRDELRRAALSAIDAGAPKQALGLLLADHDDWWDGPPPAGEDLNRLVRERDSLSLRDAMDLLGYGRVGHYFAHRWSDPTFMAGLALIDAHWTAPRTVFELACGIGHYLGELAQAGVGVAGGDVVFSKLWLARHWVLGEAAELVCFDAQSPWPIAGRRFDLVLCQDAFYFLEPKAEILAGLRALAGGPLAIGHVHNRDAENFSSGAAVTADEVAALFPDALVYDDADLTRAAERAEAPVARPPEALRGVEAFAIMEGVAGPARAPMGPLCATHDNGRCRRNPLYRPAASGCGAEIVWPSERYGAEYGPRATYPRRTTLPEHPRAWTAEQVRRREVVALPERW